MRTTSLLIGGALAITAGYFLLWPVPVDPLAWQAPVDRGYVDPFAPNDLLAAVTAIDLGEFVGPEDATLGNDGRLYVTIEDGHIARIQNRGVSLFANVGGRPLGIESDADGLLVVANAERGLQRIGHDGAVELLLGEIEGEPLRNANNVGIGPDGTIYFSQSSSKFTSIEFGGSYSASLLDLLEHGGHGNVFAFNPDSGQVTKLLSEVNYANGVAASDDGTFVLVVETGHYRILKYWLSGDKQGTSEVLIDNLPGFPDNINN